MATNTTTTRPGRTTCRADDTPATFVLLLAVDDLERLLRHDRARASAKRSNPVFDHEEQTMITERAEAWRERVQQLCVRNAR